MSRRKRALLLAGICIAALLLRIGYAAAFDRFSEAPKWDARYYCDAARNILAGKGLTYDGLRPSTLWPPLCPVFLAGVFGVFGDDFVIARLVLMCVDVVTIVLVYLLASKIFDYRAGFVAAGIAAVYPYFIYRSAILMTEPLVMLLLTALALLLLHMKTGFRRRHIPAAGVLCALLMLCRANMQMLILILPLWGFFAYGKWRPALARTLPIVAIMLLLVAPYFVRNAKIEGRFVGISTTGGMTFYGAHNEIVFNDPEFDGFWVNIQRFGEQAPLIDEKIKEADNSDRLFRLGFEAIRKNPGKMPMHLLHKLRNFWLIHVYYYETGGISAKIPQLVYLALLPFFVIGLIVNYRSPRKTVFFYLMFAMLTLTTFVFYGNARFRAPVEPMIITLASGGIVYAARKALGRRRRAAAAEPREARIVPRRERTPVFAGENNRADV